MAVWASQPSIISGRYQGAGAATSTAFTLENCVKSFEISSESRSLDVFCSNKKVAQDGGLLQTTHGMALSTYRAGLLTGALATGTKWKNTVISWAAEGEGAGATGYGTLTATVAIARLDSVGQSDDGGRQLVNAQFTLRSTDGVTAPVAWAIA